jgi:hypothetical protein
MPKDLPQNLLYILLFVTKRNSSPEAAGCEIGFFLEHRGL